MRPRLHAIAAGLFLGWIALSPAVAGAGEVGHIAYVDRVDGVNHIFLMDIDGAGRGSNPRRVTADAEAENYPNWSPDGKYLVYQRDLHGAALYLIAADGSGQRRLSPDPGLDVTASFSPGGGRIVYTRLYQAPRPGVPPQVDLRVMNLDGSDDHAILANVRFAVEPRWSVNDRIVFMSLMAGPGLDVYVLNADGSGLHPLTTSGLSGVNNGDPVWSADGARISFGSDREGNGKLNVFAMDADGSHTSQLTHFDAPYEAGDTHWSSDKRRIAFEWDVAGAKQSDPDARAEVWTMNADGSDAASTGIRCAAVGCAPRWQPAIYVPPRFCR